MPASVPRELDPVAGMSMDALIEPVAADLELCRQNLLRMLGHRHPMLMAAANQIFSGGGKQLRPLVVLLVAKATLPLMNLRQVQGGLRGACICLFVGVGLAMGSSPCAGEVARTAAPAIDRARAALRILAGNLARAIGDWRRLPK